MPKKKIFDIFVILSILLLAACQIPVQLVTQVTPQPVVEKNDSNALILERMSVMETKMADLSLQGKSLPSTPVPLDTLVPLPAATNIVATPTQYVTPAPTSIIPCNRAAFKNDVTIPDGTIVQLGDTFTKTWRFLNSGSCTWGDGYTLVFDHGNPLSGPQSIPLPKSVVPGDDLIVSVNLTAPSFNANYESYWMLQDPSGNRFGIGPDGKTAFWAKITAGIYRPQDPEVFGNCSLVDVTPSAYTIFPTSKPVQIKWVIRNNTGTSWVPGKYTVNFVKGDRMQTTNDQFIFNMDVAPGETGFVVVNVVTPDRPGAFTTVWSINDGGKKLCVFSATLKVK